MSTRTPVWPGTEVMCRQDVGRSSYESWAYSAIDLSLTAHGARSRLSTRPLRRHRQDRRRRYGLVCRATDTKLSGQVAHAHPRTFVVPPPSPILRRKVGPALARKVGFRPYWWTIRLRHVRWSSRIQAENDEIVRPVLCGTDPAHESLRTGPLVNLQDVARLGSSRGSRTASI